MATKKLRSIKGRRVRFTALDECGVPDLTNPCASIVTSGFISVTWSDELETGEEFTQKNAWGDFCIAEKDADRVKWTNVTIALCEIDPQILVMLGGATENRNSQGDLIGAFFTGEPNPLSFAIEVWTKKGGQDACAPGGGDPEWGYFAGYNVRNGMLDGDLTIENAPMTLSIKGEIYGASEEWGAGPYNDNPTESSAGVPAGALRYVGVTTVQPPEDTDGCVAILPATGATAGSPGTWTPSGSNAPQTLLALQGAIPPIAAAPVTNATITNVAVASNVVTITTAAAHTLAVGDQVTIDATTNNVLDGTYTLTVASGSTFSFAKTTPNITAVADTGTVIGRKKWTTGQHVLLGDNAKSYWNGNAWVAGQVP